MMNNNKRIKVRINSTYAIGRTEGFLSQFASGKDPIMELDEGTSVNELLHQLPSIGTPEQWDDIMLYVFVNGEVSGFNRILKNNDIIDLHLPASGG